MVETGAVVLGGVDRAIFVSSFVGALRRAGIPTAPLAGQRLAEAWTMAGPGSRTELYWLTRICLIHDRRYLETFDRLFDVIFEGGTLPTGRDARKARRDNATPAPADQLHRISKRSDAPEVDGGVPWSSAPSAALDADVDPDTEIGIPELLPAAMAAVADEPFDQLSEAELALIGSWLERLKIDWPRRPVRRAQRASGPGRLDLRRTLAAARRTGGEPVTFSWTAPRSRPRRVVMLVDVSGSMQTFVRPYLHVLRALSTTVDCEGFAFATDLTRITPALRRSEPAVAVVEASALVDDRFSGTRIATSLATLLGNPAWSNTVRGATVLIASDGWDTDEPDDLGRRMARLARMARRIVWVNPRAAAEGYQPLVAGMAAALPHCDVMLPGHTLRAMRDVVGALARP